MLHKDMDFLEELQPQPDAGSRETWEDEIFGKPHLEPPNPWKISGMYVVYPSRN